MIKPQIETLKQILKDEIDKIIISYKLYNSFTFSSIISLNSPIFLRFSLIYVPCLFGKESLLKN